MGAGRRSSCSSPAARRAAAAEFMARSLGERAATRSATGCECVQGLGPDPGRVVTEGVFTRIISTTGVEGVAGVGLDEFHEPAWTETRPGARRDSQRLLREDLRLWSVGTLDGARSRAAERRRQWSRELGDNSH